MALINMLSHPLLSQYLGNITDLMIVKIKNMMLPQELEKE